MKTLMIGLLLIANTALALEDMVLVNSTKPFYLDIFETTSATADAINGSSDIDTGWKPARIIQGRSAEELCIKLGKRIPTLEEWKLAASNLGQNVHYTLIGDVLYDTSNNRLKANVRGSASITPTDFNALGIDAVGTVGMTGNRAEWVATGDSKNPYAQCGRQYETQNDQEVELRNICVTDPAGFFKSATVRCAVTYAPSVVVTNSANIKGELLNYLTRASSTFTMPTDGTGEPGTELETILIPVNKYSSKKKMKRSRLNKPTPHFDDEY